MNWNLRDRILIPVVALILAFTTAMGIASNCTGRNRQNRASEDYPTPAENLRNTACQLTLLVEHKHRSETARDRLARLAGVKELPAESLSCPPAKEGRPVATVADDQDFALLKFCPPVNPKPSNPYPLWIGICVIESSYPPWPSLLS